MIVIAVCSHSKSIADFKEAGVGCSIGGIAIGNGGSVFVIDVDGLAVGGWSR